jgi:hypothetical protein
MLNKFCKKKKLETGQLYTNCSFSLTKHVNIREKRFGRFIQDRMLKASLKEYQTFTFKVGFIFLGAEQQTKSGYDNFSFLFLTTTEDMEAKFRHFRKAYFLL